jgi:N-sulfoglucosamine sulfohydrolase
MQQHNSSKPISRRQLGRMTAATGCAAILGSLTQCISDSKPMPNIIWIVGEDMGPDLGCYGTPLVHTPNLDRIAAEGMRFTNCYTTAPVCSASRSAIATGMYQTSIDAQNQRSHRKDGYSPPSPIRILSHYLRDLGYFTSNVRPVDFEYKARGKDDFNFQAENIWDGMMWTERQPGQPFFAQINFQEPHRGPSWERAAKQKQRIDPDQVTLPPWYPDIPELREEWAWYLDAVNLLDVYTGDVIKRLEQEGHWDDENTIIMFFGDNGRCELRGKQFLYDAGIQVPLMVRWPGHIQPGTVNDDLISGIDFAPTFLNLAGMTPPDHMHGQVFLGPDAAPPREYIIAARDRVDEAVDRIRCVRTKNYKYIRNYMPEVPYLLAQEYREKHYPSFHIMKRLYAEGKLTPEQAAFAAPTKPEEELYDLVNDPNELRNLEKSAEHQPVLEELRALLDQWDRETDDKGRIPG